MRFHILLARYFDKVRFAVLICRLRVYIKPRHTPDGFGDMRAIYLYSTSCHMRLSLFGGAYNLQFNFHATFVYENQNASIMYLWQKP